MWIRCARLILRHQTDTTGTSWDEYPDLLFIGEPEELGMLAKAAVWVIYKRNDVADWAQFAEVFGAPIREYTYPTDDDEARRGRWRMRKVPEACRYSCTPRKQ